MSKDKAQTQTKTKNRKGIGGRPTDYTKELAELICQRIASLSIGTGKLCKMFDDMPNESTIYAWLYQHEEFSKLYAKAKLKQADLLAHECLDIADDAKNDYMESVSDEESAPYRYMGEHVNRSRLRIDTRKWLASKLLPKVFGDQKKIESLEGENDALRNELKELRSELDSKHKKEY